MNSTAEATDRVVGGLAASGAVRAYGRHWLIGVVVPLTVMLPFTHRLAAFAGTASAAVVPSARTTRARARFKDFLLVMDGSV